MHALGRPVLLLKEMRFQPRADILGTLWEEFDILHIEGTIPPAVSKWLNDLGFSIKEAVIYDSRSRDVKFDFQGVEGQFWSGKGIAAKPISPKGQGTLTIEPVGVLNIQRTNTEGRYEIRLLKYTSAGADRQFVPRNESIFGQRKLKITCEARVRGGEHSLRFVLKDHTTEDWIGNEKIRISGNDWTLFSVYFRVTPAADFWLRIDDEEPTQVPSTVQIRNLVLSEDLSQG